MQWFVWACVLLVLAGGAVVASGRLGALPGTVRDAPLPDLPDGPLTAADLRGLEFEVVPRGYSTAQVDEVLDRLQAQLEEAADQKPRPGVSDASAIMEADEFSQQAERENQWQQ